MYTLSTGSKAEITDSMAISLTICGIDEDQPIELDEVLTVPHIPLKAASAPSDVELKHMKHLQSVTLSEWRDKSVGLLIGLDASTVFRPLQSIYGPEGTPHAIKTVLGWALISPAPNILKTDGEGVSCMHLASANVNEDSEGIEQVFADALTVPSSREDRISYQLMKDSIQLSNGHFQLPLL